MITIVILLILAGVSIAMLTGDDGIITRANEASEKTLEGQVKEEIELMSTEYIQGKYTEGEKNIKKYYQSQASKGEISSIKDNGDGTYTITKDGYEVKIDGEGDIIDIKEQEEVKVTEVWYKIDGTTLHLSNSDLGGYLKHDENLSEPEWVGSYSVTSPITKVIFENRISPTNTAKYFFGFGNLTEIDNIEYLDTSNVTDMSDMFNNCSSLTKLDLSGFDTRKVKKMDMMFFYCVALTELDVSSLNFTA